MEKVIVTGANGFLGYALVKRLESLGVLVYAVVREGDKKGSRLEQLKNVRVVECSLEHMCILPELIQSQEYDAFYHFAWQGVSGQDSRNLYTQITNVKYACDAVWAAKSLGAAKFIFAASIMEYEVMKLMETTQDADQRSVYRTAKLSAHYFTRNAANNLGIIYHAANISNVYGVGEISDRFINSTIRGMLRGERVKFSEAEQKYDFIYIDDAVDMLYLIGNQGVPNKSYYIGSTHPRKLRDYICEMRDCIDSSLELGFGEYSEFVGVSLDYHEFDMEACWKDFGYKVKHTFRDGVLRTVEWMKEMETLG